MGRVTIKQVRCNEGVSNGRGLSSKVKWALLTMLVAIFPALAGIVIGMAVLGETAPPLVYIFSAIWLMLFFVSLARLGAGLVGGIV